MESESIKYINSPYLEDHIKLIEKLYLDDQVIECIEYVKYLESEIFSGEIHSRDKNNEDLSEYEYFKANDLVRRIFEDNDLLYKCLETYKFMQKQTSYEITDGIESNYRMEEDTRIATSCSRTIIKRNIKTIVAHFREVDMQTQEGIKITKLSSLSMFRNFYRTRIESNSIEGDVEFVTYAFGAAIPKQNSIMICMKSTSKDFFKDFIPPQDPKYKRMKCNYGFVNMKYVDENTCLVSNCYNIDPDIKLIPVFIINSFMKGFSSRVLKEAKLTLEKSDLDPYLKRTEEKHDEYDKMMIIFNKSKTI